MGHDDGNGGGDERIKSPHLHRKQAHLYANTVTARRKSRFDQTICNINNDDFVGMTINSN